MRIKIKMIANAIVNNKEYTQGFTYMIPKEIYKQMSKSCIDVKAIESAKNKMMKKYKNKGL